MKRMEAMVAAAIGKLGEKYECCGQICTRDSATYTEGTVGGHEYALRNVTGYKPICDGKCTGATGPNCDCICGGENHGTGRVVPIYTERRACRISMCRLMPK
jgi:hypothetical protein